MNKWLGTHKVSSTELPPESSPVEVVSKEIEISSDTLERWRSEALAAPNNDKTWMLCMIVGGPKPATIQRST